jgi:hypothetical protein
MNFDGINRLARSAVVGTRFAHMPGGGLPCSMNRPSRRKPGRTKIGPPNRRSPVSCANAKWNATRPGRSFTRRGTKSGCARPISSRKKLVPPRSLLSFPVSRLESLCEVVHVVSPPFLQNSVCFLYTRPEDPEGTVTFPYFFSWINRHRGMPHRRIPTPCGVQILYTIFWVLATI